VPAGAQKVSFSVTYVGSTIPPGCSLKFTISSFATHSFKLNNTEIYLSASISIDRSSSIPPMILYLTLTPRNSTEVGRPIVSSVTSGSTSTNNYYNKNPPTVYKLTLNTVGSNQAKFLVTTSHNGTVYFVILKSGTPTNSINQTQIYSKIIDNSISFGNSTAILDSSGVNTISTLVVS
jgi:hypothetical protein